MVRSTQLLQSLPEAQRTELRKLVDLFLNDKDFYGAAGLEVERRMAAVIAAQACLPVLNLGYRWLSGWHSIYVYPGQFRTRRTYRDHNGLEYEDQRALAGEAQHTGGLVFSWQDIEEDLAYPDDGANVIIHEIAHKLDMQNGDADGYPPLHRGMASDPWASAMQSAYDDLGRQLDAGVEPEIDPYAATDPAEFFAVMSEYYFETPGHLAETYPAVFEQLQAFYHPRR